MKKLIALILLLASFAQYGGDKSSVKPVAGCTLPTNLTYRWIPNAGCSTSVACMTDTVAGNNASQTTSGDLPTYSATGGPNSTPALAFSGSWVDFSTGIPAPTGSATYTFYEVIKLSSPTATQYLMGNQTSLGALAVEFGGTGVARLALTGTGAVATDTATMTGSTWYTKAVTFSYATEAYQFYTCSGGTCTAGAGGTATAGTYSQAINLIGARGNSSFGIGGSLAEFGYYNGISIAGLGAYSQCQYGI